MTRQTRTALIVLLISLNVCALSAGRFLTYGSNAGGWVFGRYREWPPTNAVEPALLLALVLAALFYWTLKVLPRHRAGLGYFVAFLWIAAGTIAQLILHRANFQSIGAIAVKDVQRVYYVTQLYPVKDFLERYSELAKSVGGPVYGNLPGRIVLYSWMRRLVDDPATLGMMVLIISNLCGLALYYCVSQLTGSRAAALAALVYYLFIPARVYFAPLLNIIGWAPIAIAWVVMVRILAHRAGARIWGLIFGLCIFAAFMFDVAGLTLAGLFVITVLRYKQPAATLRMSLWGLGGFMIAVVLLYWSYGLNLFATIEAFAAANQHYNLDIVRRPYFSWLIGDLWELSLGIGAPLALLCCLELPLLRRPIREQSSTFDSSVFAVVMVTIVLVDLAGVTRGEAIRIWIPLMVLPCIVAADYSVRRGPLVCAAALFALIFQTAITISMYRFIN